GVGFMVFGYVQKMRAASAPATQVEQTNAASAPAQTNVSPTNLPLAPSTDEATPAGTPTSTATPATAVSLRLQFVASSWVEIYDAANKRLLYDIGQPGQSRTVSGQAPLRVTLGLSSAVTAMVNDKPVAVPRRAGRDAARFTVMA